VAGEVTEPGSPAMQARLGSPFGVSLDHSGNLFLVEMTGFLTGQDDNL
jgi:hypothetical protein